MLPPQGNALSFDPERQVSTMALQRSEVGIQRCSVRRLTVSMQTSHSSDSETSETSETPENAVTELVECRAAQKQAQAALHGSSGRSRQ